MVTVKYRIKSSNNSINHWNSSGVTDGVKKTPQTLEMRRWIHNLYTFYKMTLVFWGFLNSSWLQMHDLKIIWLSSSFLDLSVKFVLVGYWSLSFAQNHRFYPKKHLPHKMHLKCADILRLLIHARHKFLEDHSCYIKPLKAQI